MARGYLEANGRNLLLGYHGVVVNDVGQRATLHVLHDDPQLRVVVAQKGIEEVDNVAVLAVLHDHDLVDDELLARLVRQVHLLDGDLRPRAALPQRLHGDGRVAVSLTLAT